MQRLLLVEQAAAVLRGCIESGEWREWLPAERTLAPRLRVSRGTLRAALTALVTEGWLRPEHGRGYRVLRPSQSRSREPAEVREVHLLAPAALTHLRLQSARWVEHLRDRLRRDGFELLQHPDARLNRGAEARAVATLVERHPRALWLLAHSSRELQAWFVRRAVRCVVAGYPHVGIDLPHVAVDQHAGALHAARHLARFGHRRIACLLPRSVLAGDRRTAEGFAEAGRGLGERGVEARVVQLARDDDAAVCAALARLFGSAWRPTALYIARQENYVTAASFLPRLGLRVPEDVSLLARERDVLLAHLVPRPSGYTFAPATFAQRLAQLIRRVAREGATDRPARSLLLPEFVEGASVSRRRPAADQLSTR